MYNKIIEILKHNPIKTLLSLTFLTYLPILFNGFVWDDEEQIVNNVLIHSLKNFNLFLYGGTFNTGGAYELSGWFFRPMINISFAFLFSIFGFNAWGYHLFSLIIHLINTFLIYKIFELINSKYLNVKNLWPLCLSIFFGIHPSIVEAVAYISALGDLMVTLSLLLSLYLILKYSNRENIKFPIVTSLILLMGLFYKESAFSILPILIFFILYFKNQIKLWQTWLSFTIAPFLVYFLLRIPVASKHLQSPHYSPISEASILERLLTIPKILFHYILLYFYPHKLSVSQHFVVKELGFVDFFLPIIMLILLSISIYFLFYKNKINKKILVLGIVFCIFSFGLILNIVPLDMTVAERWFYLPIIGLLFISYSILLKTNQRHENTIVLFIIFYCVFLSTFSFERNFQWKNGLTLYLNDIKINESSFDLNNNAGVELFRAGEIDQAKKYFERSIELQPKWYFAYNNLGVVYDIKNNFDEAEKLFNKTLEKSDYHLAHVNLCRLHSIRKKDFIKAENICEESLKKLPNNIQLWIYLTISKYENGKYEEALDLASKLKSAAPSNDTIYLYETISKKDKFEY